MPKLRTLRVNFNAPGDQMDAENRLWLAWPRPVDRKGAYFIQPVPLEQEVEADGFRLNADQHPIANTQTPWLYTSGLAGPLKFTVQLSNDTAALYRVALHFADTEGSAVGRRVFDVRLQGKTVISHMDIVSEAGGTNMALTKAFPNVAASGTFTVELVPVQGKPPLLCALEVLRQEREDDDQ
jgi:hypothetical protein